MSREKPPQGKEPTSLQSTRQMLDELDELMERMLSLPVQDVEAAAAAPREIVRLPTMSATLTVLERPAADEEPSAAPRESGGSARQLPREVPNYSTELDSPAADLAPEPIPEEAIPPGVQELPLPEAPAAPSIEPMKVKRRSLAGLLLQLLLWTNQGFDRATLLLGGPGQWLRGSRGRSFLGRVGLVLLLLAIGWLLKDWLGWAW